MMMDDDMMKVFWFAPASSFTLDQLSYSKRGSPQFLRGCLVEGKEHAFMPWREAMPIQAAGFL